MKLSLYQDLKERAYESKKSMADYIRGILINDLYGISDTDTSSIKQTKLIKKLDHHYVFSDRLVHAQMHEN